MAENSNNTPASSLESLADDLDTARALLALLDGDPIPSEARQRIVLHALAMAPTLASAAARLTGDDALDDDTAALLEVYLDTPLALQSIYDVAYKLSENTLYGAALAYWDRYFRAATVLNVPDDELTPMHHERGYCLSALERHDEALDAFQEAAQESGDFVAQSCIGYTLLELGRMTDASAAFEAAVECAERPQELVQALAYVTGEARLAEFEGQRGGLDARDLHYVLTAGVVLLLSGERDGIVIGSGYFGALAQNNQDVAYVLVALSAMVAKSPRKPTCVVPLHNHATPLSLAAAEVLGVPHLSAKKAVEWDRPLVVATRLTTDEMEEWDAFVEPLSKHAITFVYGLDWSAEQVPTVDITGVMASTCTFPWVTGEDAQESDLSIARTLVEMARAHHNEGAIGRLNAYYEIHVRHRLAAVAAQC